MKVKIKIMVVEEDSSKNKKILKYLKSDSRFDLFKSYYDHEKILNNVIKINPCLLIFFCKDLKEIFNSINSINVIDKDCKFIIFSPNIVFSDLIAVVNKNVMGWISEDIDKDFFISIIYAVINGGYVVIIKDARNVLNNSEVKSIYKDDFFNTSNLTEREIAVLTLLTEGASNKTIANVLYISENTAKTHVRNILEKLQIRSRMQAALYAIEKGFKKTD
jgi:DNA-binding NarL/FixJ family response regulator